MKVRPRGLAGPLAGVPDEVLLRLHSEADPRPVLYGDGSVAPEGWHDAWRAWTERRHALYAEHGRDTVTAEARRRCEAIGDGMHDQHGYLCPRCVTSPRSVRR